MVPAPVRAQPSGRTVEQTQTYHRRSSRECRLWKMFQLQDKEKSIVLDAYHFVQKHFWFEFNSWESMIHKARYDLFKR